MMWTKFTADISSYLEDCCPGDRTLFEKLQNHGRSVMRPSLEVRALIQVPQILCAYSKTTLLHR